MQLQTEGTTSIRRDTTRKSQLASFLQPSPLSFGYDIDLGFFDHVLRIAVHVVECCFDLLKIQPLSHFS